MPYKFGKIAPDWSKQCRPGFKPIPFQAGEASCSVQVISEIICSRILFISEQTWEQPSSRPEERGWQRTHHLRQQLLLLLWRWRSQFSRYSPNPALSMWLALTCLWSDIHLSSSYSGICLLSMDGKLQEVMGQFPVLQSLAQTFTQGAVTSASSSQWGRQASWQLRECAMFCGCYGGTEGVSGIAWGVGWRMMSSGKAFGSSGG